MTTDTTRAVDIPGSVTLGIAVLPACVLMQATAAAQAKVPVVVRVTELVQLNSNRRFLGGAK